MSEEAPRADAIYLSSLNFLSGCCVVAAVVGAAGGLISLPSWVLAAEVLLTVIALFIFGSIRYRIDKNALTFGAAIVMVATFVPMWWPSSGLKAAVALNGVGALGPFLARNFLTLHGLDKLVHADTMLFILGLTFFVAVIGQTRILESLSFAALKRNKGRVFPTIALLAAVVSFASGILDGVSMIGLMIRTLIIILFLAKAPEKAAISAVIVSTIVTTVCGMWLAYGEPPNLIMKSNLQPHLDDAFFLRYCLPIALASYVVVLFNMRKLFGAGRVEMEKLDVIDLHTADVRFLQAERHGEVLSAVEFVHAHKNELQEETGPLVAAIRNGQPLGEALVSTGVSKPSRLLLLGRFVAEDLSEPLDFHYSSALPNSSISTDESLRTINAALEGVRQRRRRAQIIGAGAFAPFIGFLIWHAVDHAVPLFWSSFAGFLAALPAIWSLPKVRRLALKEARHEFSDYLFLLPLFLSITLLQKVGFFDQAGALLQAGIHKIGITGMALGQFAATTFLSGVLDNNVVADFGGRALRGLEVDIIHLFAMAQIAGYAIGGCLTHIGSAQSVVAYSFLRKELNPSFTPFDWIRTVSGILLQLFLVAAVIIGVRSFFHG